MSAPAGLAARTRLNNGVEIPWLGLGTYLVEGEDAYRAVSVALEVGYRHVDTAAFYANEQEVGRAIRDSGIPRQEIFVATKLWNSDHGREEAREAFARSRERLDVGAIDLYLIHWPVPGRRMDSWRTLEDLYHEGECRAIGVSNYTAAHLDEVLADGNVVPAVNQVEFSPFLYQRQLLDLCRQREVQLEAYSPLTKSERLANPRLVEIAGDCQRTPAQVLIRWCLQRQVVVIPKAASAQHIQENVDVFEWQLSAESMAALDALHENLRTSWDPTNER